MVKYTHKENKQMIKIMDGQAHGIGLLEPNEYLVYEQGNTARGIATVLRVVRKDENQNRHPQPRPVWLPEFGYRDGPSVIGAAIYAASNVIYHLFMTQVNAEHEDRKRKMNYLAEHTARRSGTELPPSVTDYPHPLDSSFDQ